MDKAKDRGGSCSWDNPRLYSNKFREKETKHGKTGDFQISAQVEELWVTANQVQPQGKGERGGLNHVTDHGGTTGETISVQNTNQNSELQQRIKVSSNALIKFLLFYIRTSLSLFCGPI